jgi:predicted transcriptional regulator of viral defense system
LPCRGRQRLPKGVICLISALAFHGITDQMPRRVWIALGPKDWKPQIDYPPPRIVRFTDKFLGDGLSCAAVVPKRTVQAPSMRDVPRPAIQGD